MQADRRLGLILASGTGLAFQLDFTCGKQGTFGESGTDQLVYKYAEQYDISNHCTVGKACGCKGHAECYTSLREQGNSQILCNSLATFGQSTAAVSTAVFAQASGNDIDHTD